MEYKVRLTQQAVEQIQQTVAYISHSLQEPVIARRWSNCLEKEIQSLKQHPARYPLTSEETWRSYGIRKMIVKNFFVYYWIDEAEGQVAVTAVVYGRRDQVTALLEMPLE